MTFFEWVRVANVVLFVVVSVLFGLVNWKRRDSTGRWDAMARIGSFAYWLCAAYATTDAIFSEVPTGSRQMPIFACLSLISVSYVMLLREERRKAKSDATQR